MSAPSTSHRLILGDSREMPELADASVHLVVTSPPYWSIKDYDHPVQVGTGETYEEYISSLGEVLAECHRVLHPGCRAAVNIGDQYLRASEHGRYRVQPIHADLTRVGRDIGFDFMGNIIWRKISNTTTSGGGSWMGSTYHPKDGHVTYEHEYILLFRKRGSWPQPDVEAKKRSRLTKQQRSKWFRGMWEIPPVRQDGHIAKFPLELPRRLIKMYSFHGETVLDPFLGSGTTAAAAALEGRNSVGYELNASYRVLFEETVREEAHDLFSRPELSIETRASDRAAAGS